MSVPTPQEELPPLLPDGQDAHLITVEVISGMGTVNRLVADAVPELDEPVCYTASPSQWGAPEGARPEVWTRVVMRRAAPYRWFAARNRSG
ncbi:hypothetical protein [Nonomuraea sp. NPDC050786]|uniref:hypothetical protein n=1 Tax=Nonomuraea sp. NPDC050786 TaxID=3154840 RepID=UPI00341090D6